MQVYLFATPSLMISKVITDDFMNSRTYQFYCPPKHPWKYELVRIIYTLNCIIWVISGIFV